MGISKTRTSPYHPQGDCLIERFNRTLKDQLSKCLYQQTEPWDTMLTAVQLSYNTSVHRSTGYTPFFLVHGCEARLSVHLLFSCPIEASSASVGTPAEYATSVCRCVRNCRLLSSSVRRTKHMLIHSKKLNTTKRSILPPTMLENWFG